MPDLRDKAVWPDDKLPFIVKSSIRSLELEVAGIRFGLDSNAFRRVCAGIDGEMKEEETQTTTLVVRIGTSGSVESRMGAVAWAMRQRSVSHPRSSNRTCGFPASGSPTGFVVRHTKQSTDRKRHLRGVLSSFASR